MTGGRKGKGLSAYREVRGDEKCKVLMFIQGNRVKKDSLTAEDSFNEHLCSKAFFCDNLAL